MVLLPIALGTALITHGIYMNVAEKRMAQQDEYIKENYEIMDKQKEIIDKQQEYIKQLEANEAYEQTTN